MIVYCVHIRTDFSFLKLAILYVKHLRGLIRVMVNKHNLLMAEKGKILNYLNPNSAIIIIKMFAAVLCKQRI